MLTRLTELSTSCRTKTLREHIHPGNAWNAAQFWNGVEMATMIIVGQIEQGPVPSQEAIEQMILSEWLEAYAAAGTA